MAAVMFMNNQADTATMTYNNVRKICSDYYSQFAFNSDTESNILDNFDLFDLYSEQLGTFSVNEDSE